MGYPPRGDAPCLDRVRTGRPCEGARVRAFYDTEFIEAPGRPVELISIGVVTDAGEEYYACSTAFSEADAGDWVRRNVIPQLPSPAHSAWRAPERIAAEVQELLTREGTEPQTWAWYGAYDHVVLAQLYGTMSEMPALLPRWTRDLRQLWEHLGRPRIPKQRAGKHDALADARHNRKVYEALAPLARARGLVV